MKELIKRVVPPKLLSVLMPVRFCCRNRAAWLENRWREFEAGLMLPESSTYASSVDVTIGIIKDPNCLHQYYVHACREMQVPYRLFDIFSAHWYEEIVQNEECKAFLVAPRIHSNAWRQMYDERLRIMVQSDKTIFPTYDELWMYESKRRMSYWLKLNGFDAPKTYIFYSYLEALEFAQNTELPIVAKTDVGYSAHGVRIFRKRSQVVNYVKKCFNKGIKLHVGGFNPFVENDYVLFQEYISTPCEWRLIRIGESYFAHQKLKSGDFHSGTGKVKWISPGRKHLNLLRQVTNKGSFKSINLDVFELEDGRLLINELQAFPGMKLPYQMVIDGQPGRYLYDIKHDKWQFEKGDFCENKGANLRLQALLNLLGFSVSLSV